MLRYKLSECGARGWFIGDFDGAVHRNKDFEVNYQKNPRGPTPSHTHKIVHEIQLVIRGKMLVNGEIFLPGDICMLEPNDISQIEYLEDTETVAIKFPSCPSDKYYL